MGKDAWKVTDVFILRNRLSNIFYNPSTNFCQFASSDLNLLTKGTDPFSHHMGHTDGSGKKSYGMMYFFMNTRQPGTTYSLAPDTRPVKPGSF
jgi:hypothetical protein